MEWEEVKGQLDSLSPADRHEIEFVRQLVIRRMEAGLTQRDLAKKVGMKQSSIARLESLNVTPRMTTVIKILEALDLELAIIKKK